MKRYFIIYLITLLFLMLLRVCCHAQQAEELAVKSAIKVIAHAKDNTITLRWAPTTSVAWEFANKHGYSVQRITLTRDDHPLIFKDKVMLSQRVLPQPLPGWESEVKQNKYAAVAAQALYGKQFKISQQTSGVMQVVNQAKEGDQRFSFALLAADYSPVVASLSGLSITDNHPNIEEGYLYKVWVNMPDKHYTIDTGYVYTSLKSYHKLPALQKPEVKFMDRQALISWNFSFYTNTYIAYFVERSTDGKNFESISADPIVPAGSSLLAEGIIHIIDTLADNETNYAYRVKGITPFGETGPVSETVSGHGKTTLSAAPAIRDVSVIENKRVYLKWEYPITFSKELIGYQVERSFSPKGNFELISPVLKPETSSFTDNAPGSSNYYRIVALGTDDKSYSFPHFAQLRDSIPPGAPTHVQGSADSTGVVSLRWERGQEQDLLGYRVYRSNFETHEFTQVTTSPTREPAFYDTINLKTSTKNIYYKIVAIDLHFNPSAFSETIALARPDILPPVPPSFRNIEYKHSEGIIVRWVPSGSEDIKQYLLYRRAAFDNAWHVVAAIPGADSSLQFIDKQVVNKNTYEYVMISVDEAGLVSKPSNAIRITVNDRSNKPAIEKFSVRKDTDNKQILLTWLYEAPDVKGFLIYRSGEGEPMRLFETVAADILQYSDKQLTVNSQYQYTIKAVFKDGAHSPFSKAVKILY